jgi:hypothetical protein
MYLNAKNGPQLISHRLAVFGTRARRLMGRRLISSDMTQLFSIIKTKNAFLSNALRFLKEHYFGRFPDFSP